MAWYNVGGRYNPLNSGGVSGYVDWNIDPLDLLGQRAGQDAANQQQAAQENARRESMGMLNQQRADLAAGLESGRSFIAGGTQQGVGAVQQGGSLADMYYQQGLGQGTGALNTGYGSARQSIAQLQGQQGPQAYDLTSRMDPQLAALQAQQSGISGIAQQVQMDPGYEFRRQQGEDAMNRAASARGGRLGGAQLKALSEYNQNLASQEYGNAYNRAMQTQAQGFGQQAQIGQLGLASYANQAGRSDAMGQYGQQRQDTLGMAQSQNSIGQGQGLASLYGNTANAQAQNAQAVGNATGQMYYGQGNNLANLGLQYGQAQGDVINGMIQTNTNAAQYAGMQDQAQANARGQLAGTGAGLFSLIRSDRRLKDEIRDGSDASREMLDSLSPSVFRYRDPSIAGGDVLGVMAQDLERSELGKTLVVDTGFGKAIDPARAISALLATVAHLNKRIADLEGRVA